MAPQNPSRADLKEDILKFGVASLEVINEALREQEKSKAHLLDILFQHQIDEKKLLEMLVNKYGYKSVNLGVFMIEGELLALVPKAMSEKYHLLPVTRLEHTLTVAFANPLNLKAIDEIQAVTKLRIKPVVAQFTAIKKAIEKYYSSPAAVSEQSQSGEDGKKGQELDELVKMIDVEQEQNETPQTAELMKVAYETPVIKLVNTLMLEGIRRKASDIFIEPWEKHVRVRARVDGLLEEIVRPHKSLGPAIVSRIKVMSELNIAEHRIPQDGRFKVKMSEREVDMRVSILPTTFGEKVCLRILDTRSQSHDISKLGFNEEEQQVIRDSAEHPHGMILVTGPTGSGKTTTLYSVLKYLDRPAVNLTTVEDPVEYQISGINQVNVKEHIGLTFPAALRSILRQDPDVILIGEIRDAQTLDIAVKAALTGHLVLSTLHTNDAASSVTRMMNMGLEPFLISSTILMISAQRLVRRLCSRCRISEEIDKDILLQLGIDPKLGTTFYKGKGCAQCRQSGYKGRSVITEILEMTPGVRELIMKGESSEKIKAFGHSKGMTTLRECALRKAREGETSLEEVFRVTSEDQGMDEENKAPAKEKAA